MPSPPLRYRSPEDQRSFPEQPGIYAFTSQQPNQCSLHLLDSHTPAPAPERSLITNPLHTLHQTLPPNHPPHLHLPQPIKRRRAQQLPHLARVVCDMALHLVRKSAAESRDQGWRGVVQLAEFHGRYFCGEGAVVMSIGRRKGKGRLGELTRSPIPFPFCQVCGWLAA